MSGFNYWEDYAERNDDAPARAEKPPRKREPWGTAARPFTEAHKAEAQRLIDEGWFSTSNKYHDLARLPPGMTAKEALRTFGVYDRRTAEWSEETARSQYLRLYARPADRLTVDGVVFKCFKALGGRTA